MTQPQPTHIQRVAPEIVAVLADDIRVLGDSGGDIDCAVRGVRPHWPLRLAGWKLCQQLRYDVPSWYLVFARHSEILAIDILDDPHGAGKYGFPTHDLFDDGQLSGALAGPPERAAYLTAKRLFKRQAGEPAWSEIARLANDDPASYEARLCPIFGPSVAAEIGNAVRAGRGPDAATAERWRAAIGSGRPRLARTARRIVGRLERLLERLTRPTGLVVLVVGPDGTGKSTLAEALPDACGQLFRRSRNLHFRPGLLPRPGALVGRPQADSSRPHALPARGRLTSLALLTYMWLDALLGHLAIVAPAKARTTLVVIERGFLDIAVDPARYRMTVPPGLVRLLGRLLPKPDLVLVLDADPGVVVARKDELPRREIARQSAVLQELTRGMCATTLDVGRTPMEVLTEARRTVIDVLEHRAVNRADGGWASVPPSASPRLYMPRSPRAAARGALRLEMPVTSLSRAGVMVLDAVAALGLLRFAPSSAPPPEVRELLAPFLSEGATFALKRSIHHGRFIGVILESSGRPNAIVKLASDEAGRERIRAEEHALRTRANLLEPPLFAPGVIAADDGILVLEWMPHRWRRRPWRLAPEVARALGVFFAKGMSEGRDSISGPAHGDAAPWNLLQNCPSWALVDWEVSLDEAPPFFDVFHYVVQAHAALHRPRRNELLRGIQGEGWIGEALAAYADGAGISVSLASASFDRYLEHTTAPATRSDTDPNGVRLRRELMSAARG